MQYRKIEGIAYNLHIIKTDKFKKTMIKINFKNKLIKDDIVKRRMIPTILVESNSIYNTKRLLNIKTEDLYNLNVYSDVTMSGNAIVTSFIGAFLNDKYADGLLKESLNFIFDLIFKPNIVDNKFDTNAFLIAKKSLIEEIESVKEDPKEYATERCMEELDSDSPLAFHAYGYIESLDSVNEENLYEYYLSMLKSDIVDIFIIGDVDYKEVENVIKDNFIINTKKRSNYTHYIEHTKLKNKYHAVKDTINNNQSVLMLAYKLTDLTDEERQYVLPIYSYILGGGPDSKLFKKVREENSLCYSIYSQIRMVSNIMLITSGIDAKDYKKATDLIKKQVVSMNKGEFTDEDIEKAKLTYISAYKEVMDSIPAIINTYVTHEYLNTDPIEIKENKILKVTKEDIMKVIPKIHPELVYFLEGDKQDEENSPK